MTVFDTILNNLDGIAVGDRALVKDGFSVINGRDGTSGGDFVQLEVSGVFFNGLGGGGDLAGIRVGDHCLVTLNNASFNAGDGILTGAFCTVSNNDANDNERGIAVGGTNSLVTHNTANDNIIAGLEVQCPGTVTNNRASGNGASYVFDGPGCFSKNNN